MRPRALRRACPRIVPQGSPASAPSPTAPARSAMVCGPLPAETFGGLSRRATQPASTARAPLPPPRAEGTCLPSRAATRASVSCGFTPIGPRRLRTSSPQPTTTWGSCLCPEPPLFLALYPGPSSLCGQGPPRALTGQCNGSFVDRAVQQPMVAVAVSRQEGEELGTGKISNAIFGTTKLYHVLPFRSTSRFVHDFQESWAPHLSFQKPPEYHSRHQEALSGATIWEFCTKYSRFSANFSPHQSSPFRIMHVPTSPRYPARLIFAIFLHETSFWPLRLAALKLLFAGLPARISRRPALRRTPLSSTHLLHTHATLCPAQPYAVACLEAVPWGGRLGGLAHGPGERRGHLKECGVRTPPPPARA